MIFQQKHRANHKDQLYDTQSIAIDDYLETL